MRSLRGGPSPNGVGCREAMRLTGDGLAIAALEPLAAEHLGAVIRNIPGVAPRLAREGTVQETPELTFTGEDVREDFEQEVVGIAQLLRLGFARTATDEGITQM